MYKIKNSNVFSSAATFGELVDIAIATGDSIEAEDELTGELYEVERPLFALYNCDGWFIRYVETINEAVKQFADGKATKVALETDVQRLSDDGLLYVEVDYSYRSTILD